MLSRASAFLGSHSEIGINRRLVEVSRVFYSCIIRQCTLLLHSTVDTVMPACTTELGKHPITIIAALHLDCGMTKVTVFGDTDEPCLLVPGWDKAEAQNLKLDQFYCATSILTPLPFRDS